MTTRPTRRHHRVNAFVVQMVVDPHHVSIEVCRVPDLVKASPGFDRERRRCKRLSGRGAPRVVRKYSANESSGGVSGGGGQRSCTASQPALAASSCHPIVGVPPALARRRRCCCLTFRSNRSASPHTPRAFRRRMVLDGCSRNWQSWIMAPPIWSPTRRSGSPVPSPEYPPGRPRADSAKRPRLRPDRRRSERD